jgi:hypothetical protein
MRHVAAGLVSAAALGSAAALQGDLEQIFSVALRDESGQLCRVNSTV